MQFFLIQKCLKKTLISEQKTDRSTILSVFAYFCLPYTCSITSVVPNASIKYFVTYAVLVLQIKD